MSLPARLTFQLVLFAVPTVAYGVTIEFGAAANVSGDYLTLGDVATIRAADADTRQRLENAVLGPAPSPGRRTSLDAAGVRSRLRALNFDVASFDFTGRSRIVVTGGVVEKPRASTRPQAPVRDWQVDRAEQLLSDELQRHLRHRAPELGLVEVTLEVPRAEAPAIIDARVGGYQFTGGGPNWTERQSIAVRYLDRAEQVHETTIDVQVEPLPHVLVAAQDLPRGHVVRAENLARRQIENVANGVTDPRQLVGRETKKAIRHGNVVSPSDVRSIPLVRANDIVTIVSRSGGIAVKSYGRARRDGALDDEIAVQTIEERELLVGRVSGYHEVEIVTAGTRPSNATRPAAGAVTADRIPGFRFESAAPRERASMRRPGTLPPRLEQAPSPRGEGWGHGVAVGVRSEPGRQPVDTRARPARPSNLGTTATPSGRVAPTTDSRPRVSSNSKLVLRTTVPH